MSHMYFDATARAAFALGFGCTVLADACTTRALEWQGRTVPAGEVHAVFMAVLRSPYASATDTAAALPSEPGRSGRGERRGPSPV